jgi:hypothetical protein
MSLSNMVFFLRQFSEVSTVNQTWWLVERMLGQLIYHEFNALLACRYIFLS